jgi:4-hydroxybenzoate polyprenyltransferase
MGNRFKDMAGYHSIIIAHGVIGTIVFLGIVPMSTLIIRYYSRWNPYWAFKLHAWCQVMTLLLTTVVFVLGWFAVGPERSLTNPHHGIGLAIYVMVIFQVLWGWLTHKMESKRKRHRVPLKLVVSASS